MVQSVPFSPRLPDFAEPDLLVGLPDIWYLNLIIVCNNRRFEDLLFDWGPDPVSRSENFSDKTDQRCRISLVTHFHERVVHFEMG